MLTLEEKKFVVQQWNITGSWIAIRRAFLKRPGYHAKKLPALSSLKLVVNKFNEFGSITDRIKGKKSAITSTEIKKVERLYRNRQLISLRSASIRLQISRWKVRNILRLRLLKKAYKSRVRMLLTEGQRQARIAAARHLLTHKATLPKTWFTDESWFYSDGIAQKIHQKFWEFKKEAIEPISSQLEPLKVMVWGAVSTKGLIGPYFLHSNGRNITVDQYSYQNCIDWFVE